MSRRDARALQILVTGAIAACGGAPTSPAGPPSPPVDPTYDASVPNIVPAPVWTFLAQRHWGDYHLTFHMARRYYVAGAATRRWLDDIGVGAAPLQEGDRGSGVEFLVMHRAMIDTLRAAFAELPLTGSPDGFTTVGAMLDGWNSDAAMRAHLVAAGADPAAFDLAVAALDDPTRFATEDDFGRFFQTNLRLQTEVPRDAAAAGARRIYVVDKTPGIGLHNELHNLLSDHGPIDVANPKVNLASQLFWGVHGYVDWRWRQFEARHVRSADEQAAFDAATREFTAHMAHDHGGVRGPVDTAPPPGLLEELRGKAFATTLSCDDLSADTRSPECP